MPEDEPPKPLMSNIELMGATGQALVQLGVIAVSPEAAAAVLIASPMFALVTKRTLERIPLLQEGFDQRFAGREQADAHHRERAHDPEYQDAVYRVFRSMQEAIDPSVIPTLGYLGATYSDERRRPDAFYRGMARLLIDLEPGEKHDLVTMLKGLVGFERLARRGWHIVYLSKDTEKVSVKGAGQMDPPVVVPSSFRLVSLLKREQLGRNLSHQDPKWGDVRPGDTERSMGIEVIVVERMLAILEPV